MKKNYAYPVFSIGFLFFLFSLGSYAQSCDAPLDFRDWSMQGTTNGNWIVSADGTFVTQTVNGNATFFVSDQEYFNTTVEGRFRVATTLDDDYVGFVLGYRYTGNPEKPEELEMILFDWKQSDQLSARAGMRLARVTGTLEEINSDVYSLFINTADNQYVTNLATDFTSGWVDNAWYNFRIAYSESNIKIWLNGDLVMDVDDTFYSGRFGFYNLSQENTEYGSFIVPFSAVIEKQDVQCAGADNGTATAIPSSSAPGPYTYEWSTGESTATIEDLAPGTYTVTITASNGCVTTESVVVGITDDNTPPQVLVQNISVDLDANGQAEITADMVDNGSFDNCGIESMSLDRSAFDCSMIGSQTVLLTVTDTNGNTAEASAEVIVRDVSAPIVVAQDILVYLDADGNVEITPEMIDNGSFDNCTIASMTLDSNAFDCSDLGDQTVTLTVTDGLGNEASGTAVVTVQDPVTPQVIPQNITVFLDSNGEATITPEMVDNGSFDNCGIQSMMLERSSFNCSDLGENEIVLRATDVQGNVSEAVAVVSVKDAVMPQAVVQNILVDLDANGQAEITADMVDDGSFDNCGIRSMSLDRSFFDCSMVGVQTVVFTVTDKSGNTAEASAEVTVREVSAPLVVTQNISVDLDAEGQAGIAPEMIDNGSLDNCGVASMILDKDTFDCSDLGDQTVTLTVTDNYGNEAAATAIVTVRDPEAPQVLTRNITVTLDPYGEAYITPEMIDNGSYDNCGIASLSLDVSRFSCGDEGTQIVVLSALDHSGNLSMELAEVTIENDYEDLDEDGIPDNCDPEVILDVDGDGVRDNVDNCVDTYNPGQEDRNRNGIGDACEEVVFVSETLTPNGDGVNDTWMIYGIEKFPENQVDIYNRWGERVYSKQGYSNTWNGAGLNSDKSVPGGSYYYILRLYGDDTEVMKGWIYLAK